MTSSRSVAFALPAQFHHRRRVELDHLAGESSPSSSRNTKRNGAPGARSPSTSNGNQAERPAGSVIALSRTPVVAAYWAATCKGPPRRQRLAVRARRRARAGGSRAGVDGETHEQREYRSGPRSGQDRLLQFVRLLPWRGRTGGHGGPAFTTGLSAETIQHTVSGGRNQMPAFGSFLDDAAIANVSAWVLELVRNAEAKPRE